MTQRSPSPSELVHSGVKGMKWGQRKKAGGKEIRSARRRIFADSARPSDPVIASRMTRGEKVVGVLLTGPVGLVAIGATSVASRRIEYKLDKNRAAS